MLKEQIRQIIQANPDYAAVTPVIEKEILHHEIMDLLIKHGFMQRLTFIYFATLYSGSAPASAQSTP